MKKTSREVQLVPSQRLSGTEKLVAQIATSEIDPRRLDELERQDCIEYLRWHLRYPIARIARIMQCPLQTVKSDLRLINIMVAKALDHGQITQEIIGTLYSQLQTNYELALEKGDIASANKATELMTKLAQDLGQITKADQVVKHKGNIDLLVLAVNAAGGKTDD